MELRWILSATLAYSLAVTFALPSSLVDEIKATELRQNKVKRAHPSELNIEDHNRNVPYYTKPTSAKRSNNVKSPILEEEVNQWAGGDQEQEFQPADFSNIQSSLYNNAKNPFDDKSIAEYEKGFHYGTNKDKLDQALENAVLKSELYGDPGALNQYRYYGNPNQEQRRRKRRDAKKIRVDKRLKREVELTPEEILTILTLYENERQPQWGPEQPDEANSDDEQWMDAPVYPHASPIGRNPDLGPTYFLDNKPYEKRGRWGGFVDRNKRFMVAKKRNDPTHELRYLNGPNKNDFYTLSQLLSNQREPNVPLYRRLVL